MPGDEALGFSLRADAGQWKMAARPIVKKQSYLLNVVHAGLPAEEQAVQDFAQASKQNFGREAVPRVSHPVCLGF